MTQTCYADHDTTTGFYKVKYLVKSRRVFLIRSFDSPYLARKFVEKLRRSHRCVLISAPVFDA